MENITPVPAAVVAEAVTRTSADAMYVLMCTLPMAMCCGLGAVPFFFLPSVGRR